MEIFFKIYVAFLAGVALMIIGMIFFTTLPYDEKRIERCEKIKKFLNNFWK